jgi:P27 family predicted phage terminase small subunit
VGKRGPARKPTELRILDGERPYRTNTSEPAPAEVEIRVPTWLSPKARRLWRALAPDLRRKGVLTHWDTELLAQFCHAAVRAREAAAHIAREGEVIVTERGRVRSPWCLAWKDSVDVMARLGARFGLTPSDRGGLSLPEPSDAELDALLS